MSILHKNFCCGCSLKYPHQGNYNKHPQYTCRITYNVAAYKDPLLKAILNVAKSEQSSHIPGGSHTAIRGHTTLIGTREKSTNKGTDKQYVAEFSIHSTTCHI